MKPLSKGVWIGLGVLAFLALSFISLAIVVPRTGLACCPLPAAAAQAQASGIQSEASTFDPAQYRGKVLVVNFMAEWCTGCWAELPGFVRLYREYKGRGLAVVGISVQSSREGTLKLIKQFGISYPIYLDSEGRLAVERYRLTGMPSTFIYDKSGRLVKSLRGEVPEQVLRAIVEGLL